MTILDIALFVIMLPVSIAISVAGLYVIFLSWVFLLAILGVKRAQTFIDSM